MFQMLSSIRTLYRFSRKRPEILHSPNISIILTIAEQAYGGGSAKIHWKQVPKGPVSNAIFTLQPLVTVMKDKDTRQSKGVAFVLYLEKESAHKAVRALNKSLMFGRTIKCSIAKDNGRTTEFIRRKIYKDKSRCYECGDEGHLSYQCPKNLLGNREPPEKKKKKRGDSDTDEGNEDSDSKAEDDLSLKAAIHFQQEKVQAMSAQYPMISYMEDLEEEPKRKKYKKDSYFSDEEELDEND